MTERLPNGMTEREFADFVAYQNGQCQHHVSAADYCAACDGSEQ